MMIKNNDNKKTVFVYGDFNILHPGHLRLLKFAKETGTYLTVGVLGDKLSQKDNLLDEEFRLSSVKATSFVDEAFLLTSDPSDYIKIAQPSIVVKGKEHEDKYNKEANLVKEYGGQLIFTSGEMSFSSLNLLKKEFFNAVYSTIDDDIDYLNRHRIDKNSLLSYIEKFKDLNVCVIGDTIIDEYITCEALGMSQEDPTIVVSPLSTDKFIGGAAIVASHAKTLGANVNYISVVGEDDGYEYVKEYLEQLDIDVFLLKDSTRPTTLKQRFRAKNKTLLRVNHLKQHDIGKEYETRLYNKIKASVDRIDVLIFSDFSYGVLSKRLIEKITNLCQNKKIILSADSQSSSQIGDISKFKHMDIVTPTEREIRLALNDFDSGLVVLSEKLSELSSPVYVLTTLGSEGVMIYNSNKKELLTDNIPALNSYAKDVSGAGDSLITCASMALSVGANIWEATYLGSIASAIQVSRIGNVPIQKDELIKEIR